VPVLISEDWMDSTADLAQMDYRRAVDFVKKFRLNQANSGVSLERVTDAKDKNLWSARVTQSLRVIVHKDSDNWTLLYAGHHDSAYRWAETHQIQRHKITGALQVVTAAYVVEEHIAARDKSEPGLFEGHDDAYLLSLGLPESWLPTIRKVNSENLLYDVVDKLPADVAERLIDLTLGKLVTPPVPVPLELSAFESEDTRRRFVVLDDNLELLEALDAPLARWTAFLHPSQRKLVEGSFNGAVKVTGSAGTGKTVVAMHRARYQARQGKQVLLTSYVNTLCQNIRNNLKGFCTTTEFDKITVTTVHAQAREILSQSGENVKPVDDEQLARLLEDLHWGGCPLNPGSLIAEWENVIQAQAIRTWEQYRDASRRGRGKSLSIKERKLVWEVYEKLLAKFRMNNMLDWSSMCLRAKNLIDDGKIKVKFEAIIVDEVQDLKPLELMFVAALAGAGRDRLMVVGDGGQRLYANKTSFKALGIDVRGRSSILRINYRTTEQIRRFADRLLSDKMDDMDDGTELRSNTKSLLRGPEPVLRDFKTKQDQYGFIAEKIHQLSKSQLKPGEIAVFARKAELVESIQSTLQTLGVPCKQLTKDTDINSSDDVYVGTMHRAKGLEFKAVLVADVSSETVPLPFALKNNKDPQDFEESLQREKQLLYVSITRARDEVYVTWTGAPSEFLSEITNK
jgi:hypothetical protein